MIIKKEKICNIIFGVLAALRPSFDWNGVEFSHYVNLKYLV